MADNPYTRSVTITVDELVPQHDNLPQCHGMHLDGTRCEFAARYQMEGRPICGVHLRPGAMFIPERLMKVGKK